MAVHTSLLRSFPGISREFHGGMYLWKGNCAMIVKLVGAWCWAGVRSGTHNVWPLLVRCLGNCFWEPMMVSTFAQDLILICSRMGTQWPISVPNCRESVYKSYYTMYTIYDADNTALTHSWRSASWIILCVHGCIGRFWLTPLIPLTSVGKTGCLTCSRHPTWRSSTFMKRVLICHLLHLPGDCLFVYLHARSVRRHTWVLMGPDSNKMLKPGFRAYISMLALWLSVISTDNFTDF